MMRAICPHAIAVLLMVFLVVTLVSAAGIDTVAGTGDPSNNGNDGPALAINIGDPFGVEIGPDGALYVAEVRNHRVLRVDLSSRHVRSVAGTGQKGYSGDDGLARAARLNEPYEVRFSSNGSMYFVEMQNHIIRRVDAKSGRMETIAGTGQPGFGGDGGPAVDAMFNQPHSIALDRDGNIYVADIGNHRIRRIDRQTGIVETMAGTGEKKLPIEGQPARGNPVLGPRALFFDGTTLWVALREGNSIWRIDLDHGVWHHVAGTGEAGFTGDGGPASEATFNGPKGIAIGPNGDVYIADTENQAIRKVDRQSGTVTTIAGRGPQGDGSLGDGGPATEARLARPHGICVGPDGTVYLGDTLNHRVRRIQ